MKHGTGENPSAPPSTWREPSSLQVLLGGRPRLLVGGGPSLNLYIGKEPASFFLPEAAKLGFYYEVLSGDDQFDRVSHAYVDEQAWVSLLRSSSAVRRRALELLAFPGVRAVGCDPRGSVYAEWGLLHDKPDAEQRSRIAASLHAFAGELKAAAVGQPSHALSRVLWRRYLTLLPIALAAAGLIAHIAIPARPLPPTWAFFFSSQCFAVSLGASVVAMIALRRVVRGSPYAHRIFFANVVGLVPSCMVVMSALLTYADHRDVSARQPEMFSALASYSEHRTWGRLFKSRTRYYLQLELRYPDEVANSRWVSMGLPTQISLSQAEYERMQLCEAVTIEYWHSSSGSIYLARLRQALPNELAVPTVEERRNMQRRVMDPVFLERPDVNAR